MFIKKIIFMFKLLVKQLPTLFLLRKVFFFQKIKKTYVLNS